MAAVQLLGQGLLRLEYSANWGRASTAAAAGRDAAHQRHRHAGELAGLIRQQSLFVQDALELLVGEVEGDHVALVKAAVDGASEAGTSTELLGKQKKGARFSYVT